MERTCAYFRSSEIGIRMALGADHAKVVRMVVRGAMAQLVLGLLVGIPVALAGERTLAHQLFEVKSYAPVVMRAAVLLLAISRRFARRQSIRWRRCGQSEQRGRNCDWHNSRI